MPPFNPTQIKLILGAGIAILAWAVWTAVRAMHPRRRGGGGWDWYVRIAMFVFLSAVGLELIGVAEGWDFFTQDPKHILLLPGTGAAMCLLVALPAAIAEECRKRAQATQASQPSSSMSDLAVIRIAVAYVWLLVLLLPLMIFSLYGQLFGPIVTFYLGPIGFVSAVAVFWLSRAAIGKRFLEVCGCGLSERFPFLRRFEMPLRRSLKVAALIATIGLVALAVSARWDGVAGTPVFAPRTHYMLINHSVYTEVSRFRYCVAGAGFFVAWYFGASYAMLLAIHALIFARTPKLKRGK